MFIPIPTVGDPQEEAFFTEPTILKLHYTVDEFEVILGRPENADSVLELVNGRIKQKMVSVKHGMLVIRLGTRLNMFVEAGKLGTVSTEAHFRAANDPYNELAPDLCFLSNDKIITDDAVMVGMPDLAIEIKSPSNTYKELREKAGTYIWGGSRLVWLVYPDRQTVEVITRSVDTPDAVVVISLNVNDSLDGGDVLPGFTLILKDIFSA